MPVRIWKGRAVDGNVILPALDVEQYQKLVESLEGRAVELILRPFRPARSSAANRYFHGVVVPLLAEHCGYTPEEMKDALKWKFLQVHFNDGQDKPPTVLSTSGLDTKQFGEFIEQCVRLGAEMGVVVPNPGEME